MTAILGTNLICQRLGIVPSRVHFSEEKAVFEVGRGKNPNFREMKRAVRKPRFGVFKPDNCRNQGINGIVKGIFARFHHQIKQKNADFVSKLAFRGVLSDIRRPEPNEPR